MLLTHDEDEGPQDTYLNSGDGAVSAVPVLIAAIDSRPEEGLAMHIFLDGGRS